MYVLILALVLVVVLVRSRLIWTAIARWFAHHSTLNDKVLNLRFSQKLNRYIDRPTTRNIMLGSSTIAWMPNTFDGKVFANLGVASLCTTHILNSLHHVETIKADTAIVYIGVNDMIRGTDSRQIARNIHTILTTLDARQILYIPIIQSSYQEFLGRERLDYMLDINRSVSTLIEDRRNIRTVTPTFAAKDFGADRLHLNGTGNAKMKETVEEALRDL